MRIQLLNYYCLGWMSMLTESKNTEYFIQAESGLKMYIDQYPVPHFSYASDDRSKTLY